MNPLCIESFTNVPYQLMVRGELMSLGLVHSDVCGKITPKSAGGAEDFFLY